MKPQKIEKLKGILCRSVEGRYFFRTYNEDGTFTDYELYHTDLEIEISDSDAYIYERNGELHIDHSPRTLGLEGEDHDGIQ